MKGRLKALLLSPGAKSIVDRIETAVPLVRKWHRFEYEQHFLRVTEWERLFSGVYPSFDAAEAAIPAGRNNSYDNPDSATFLGHKGSVRSSDYPVLFWLAQLLPNHPRVFDFGGYLGISFYSFESMLTYPPDLQWTIYDVPAVVQAGAELARQKQRRELRFTTDFSDVRDSSLLLAFGSLQFPRQTLAEFLAPLDTRPEQIVVNKLPLTERPTFYTLHNMGPALAPYRVQNDAEFRRSMEALGYQVVAEWENPEFGCYIPLHPDESVKAFRGMYLRRNPSSTESGSK